MPRSILRTQEQLAIFFAPSFPEIGGSHRIIRALSSYEPVEILQFATAATVLPVLLVTINFKRAFIFVYIIGASILV